MKNISSIFETSFLQYRSAGDGLEIPVEYKFFGDARAVSWAENQIKKTAKNVNILMKKCMR